MVYVYFDESGNLGFSRRSTRNFVIAMVVPGARRRVENCVKHTKMRKLPRKHRKVSEVKFSKANHEVREYLLRCISNKPVDLYYLNIEKSMVYPDLRSNKSRLYNFIIATLFKWLIERYPPQHFHLIVDKSLARFQRENFDWYVENRARLWGERRVDMTITHENSSNSYGLQIADFVAGAVFHKYERDNEEYYNLIEDKICIGGTLWKDVVFYEK